MSVSVFALEADFASRNRASSICKVFFIHIILPYLYGRMSPTLVRIGTRGQLTCEGYGKKQPRSTNFGKIDGGPLDAVALHPAQTVLRAGVNQNVHQPQTMTRDTLLIDPTETGGP